MLLHIVHLLANDQVGGVEDIWEAKTSFHIRAIPWTTYELLTAGAFIDGQGFSTEISNAANTSRDIVHEGHTYCSKAGPSGVPDCEYEPGWTSHIYGEALANWIGDRHSNDGDKYPGVFTGASVNNTD